MLIDELRFMLDLNDRFEFRRRAPPSPFLSSLSSPPLFVLREKKLLNDTIQRLLFIISITIIWLNDKSLSNLYKYLLVISILSILMIINRLQIDVSPGIFEINALIKITFPTLLLALPRSVYSILSNSI